MMNFRFCLMNQLEAEEIANIWKYDDVYSFYDMTADMEDYLSFIDAKERGNKFFSCYQNDQLVAWYSIEILDANRIELGLGMKPEHTGKGFGVDFINGAMDHIASKFCTKEFILSVASFNQRAIKVYEKVGFTKIGVFMQNTNGGDYEFIKMSLWK